MPISMILLSFLFLTGSSMVKQFVTGDSMVKHLHGWEMSKKLNVNCKTFVKTFSGAKTTCMSDYVKPSARSSPDHFIWHVGTNDLSSDKSPEEIARSIIDLAASIKSKRHGVTISNIIIPADDKKLEEKMDKVNSFLRKLCKEKLCKIVHIYAVF